MGRALTEAERALDAGARAEPERRKRPPISARRIPLRGLPGCSPLLTVALRPGEVPVGCVVVRDDGVVVASGADRRVVFPSSRVPVVKATSVVVERPLFAGRDLGTSYYWVVPDEMIKDAHVVVAGHNRTNATLNPTCVVVIQRRGRDWRSSPSPQAARRARRARDRGRRVAAVRHLRHVRALHHVRRRALVRRRARVLLRLPQRQVRRVRVDRVRPRGRVRVRRGRARRGGCRALPALLRARQREDCCAFFFESCDETRLLLLWDVLCGGGGSYFRRGHSRRWSSCCCCCC